MKIIAVVSVVVAALLAGCTIVPLAGHGHGYGYGKPGHHYGHIPPGHHKHGYKRWGRRHY